MHTFVTIKELFDIQIKNIGKVEFNKKETCCGTNLSVTITTK